jgi:hypothetical protein
MSAGAGSEFTVVNIIVFILRIKDTSISVLTTQHTSRCTCKNHYLISNGIVLSRSLPIINKYHVMCNLAMNHAMYRAV